MSPIGRQDILLNDSLLVAINKPAGLASIPGRGEITSALQEMARLLDIPHSGSADPRLRLVHRLDKDTSGVLLMAKTIEAQRFLSEQFQNNRVQKQYLALVAGSPPADRGTIDAPLAPHPVRRLEMSVWKHGRPALTEWEVERRFRGFCLLRVHPRTGKTHQIRVHLKHIGLPLAVDPLYNAASPASQGLLLSSIKRGYRAKAGVPERPLIGRLTLHAQRLSFVHPEGTAVQVEAPLPKDFRAALNMLAKYGR